MTKVNVVAIMGGFVYLDNGEKLTIGEIDKSEGELSTKAIIDFETKKVVGKQNIIVASDDPDGCQT